LKIGAVAAVAALGLGLVAGALPAEAEDGAAAGLEPRVRAKVEAWIEDLNHGDFTRREAATQALRDFGPRALPLLRDAAASPAEETRARARLLVLVLEAGLGEKDDPADWTTLKGDFGRTSARGDAPARSPGTAATRRVVSSRAGIGPALDAPLALGGGVVVAARGDRVSAWRAQGLQPMWSAGPGGRILASPVIGDGRVFVGTERGLTALGLEDGRQAWSLESAYGVGAAPLASGKTLFACLADEAVVALDPATGERRWEHRCPAGRSAPVAAAGRVILGLTSGDLLALDASSGKQAWRIGVDGPMSFAPAAMGSSVLVGDGGRRLRCVDAETGRVLWTRAVKGRFQGDGPAVSTRAVVFALDSMEVEAYDPATGRRLWNRWAGTIHLSSPAMAGNLVLYGSRTRLVALDARTGDDAWQVELDAEVACPLVSDRKVYAMAGGSLVALE
jgi:outer membrane protein assembly factor BamB